MGNPTHPECSVVETMFDKTGRSPGVNESRPAPAETGDGANPITFREVGLLPTIPFDPSADPELSRQYLRVVAAQMEQAVRNRALYTRLARAHGLTNQSIGDELGITEARVRQIIAAD